jgi:hypothetical protein
VTYVGRYPPLYYAIVGWPTLLLSGPSAVYVARLCSGIATALMLTAAFASCRRLASRIDAGAAGLLGIAFLLTLTPMILFMGSAIQPSGLECSAALAAWIAAIALATGDSRPARTEVLAFVIPAGVLASIRGLSPLFLVVIVVTAALLAGRARLRSLLSTRRAVLPGAVLAAVFGVAVAFVVWAHSVTLAGTHGYVGPGGRVLLGKVLGRLPELGSEAVGVFGNLDAHQSQVSVVAWGLAVALLGVLCLLQRWGRAHVLAGLFLLGVPALMVAVETAQARQVGFVTQARYYLPLALGAPTLAVVASRGGALARGVRRLTVPVVCGVITVQVFGFLFALRRSRTGVDHQLFVQHAPWEPPVSALVLVVAFALFFAAFAVITARMCGRGADLS